MTTKTFRRGGRPPGHEIDQSCSAVVREEGLSNFIWKSHRYLGNNINIAGIGDRMLSMNWYLERHKQSIVDGYSDQPRYLNVGGGEFLRENWRVLDFSSDYYDHGNPLIDYDVDLEACGKWPIEDDSYDIVYSSATLEHLTQPAVEKALEESYRILRPGGGIHITVPDAKLLTEIYEDRNVEWIDKVHSLGPDRHDEFEPCPEGYEPEYYLVRRIATGLVLEKTESLDWDDVRADYDEMGREDFLNEYSGRVTDEMQASYPGGHRNWFDTEKLRSLLLDAGFDDVGRVYSRRSRFPELCTSDFDTRPQWSVNVEGVKPE